MYKLSMYILFIHVYIFYSLEYFKVLPKRFLFIDAPFSLNIFPGGKYGTLKMKFINRL